MTKFEKRKLVLRQQLIGAEMYDALVAMEFADHLTSDDDQYEEIGCDLSYENIVGIRFYG